MTIKRFMATIMICILCLISISVDNVYSVNATPKDNVVTENNIKEGKMSSKQKKNYKRIVNEWVKDAKNRGYKSNRIAFQVEDVNLDGIKELIVYDFTDAGSDGWYSSMYDKKGNCMIATTFKGSYANAGKKFDRVYGNISVKKYKNGIICWGERYPVGNGETYYVIQKNGSFKELAHYDCSHLDSEGNQKLYYSFKGKKVSEKTYNKKVKSFGKGKEPKLYMATQKNCNKVFGQTN